MSHLVRLEGNILPKMHIVHWCNEIITVINAMSITATSILTITNLYAPLCDEGAPDHHHQFHHHHCLLQHHHQWCHQSFKQQIIHYLPYIMLGEFENDRNLNCSSRHVPLPRLAWPPLLPHQGEVNTLTLTLTLTRHWRWHGQGIDKTLTRHWHDFSTAQNIAHFPHYVFIWKLTMWVFLGSRTLQVVLIMIAVLSK